MAHLETMSGVQASTYDRKELDKMHIDTFRKISAQYGKGRCVGVGSWQLRISNDRIQLVTSYQVKGEDGQWSGVCEWTEAL